MTITPNIKRDYLSKITQNGKRADGRKFDEFRKIMIETGFITKAEGSAKVKIGNTQVIAGIKMDLGEPYPDTPESGVMTTAAEMIPMASPDFEAGPPRENAIDLIHQKRDSDGVIKLRDTCSIQCDDVDYIYAVYFDSPLYRNEVAEYTIETRHPVNSFATTKELLDNKLSKISVKHQ